MKFEIKNRLNGNVIFSIETDNWKLAVEAAIKGFADLRSANLHSADLSSADLHFANLSSANLRFADLRFANLRFADLRSANLSSANLRFAEGVNKNTITPLMILYDQVGEIRAYKLVKANGEGPCNGGIVYIVGERYSVVSANTDDTVQCAPGINLATLDWCIINWQTGFRILVAEFTTQDIAAIPIATDGKFRVHRCKIVGEKDLIEIGLVEKNKWTHAHIVKQAT